MSEIISLKNMDILEKCIDCEKFIKNKFMDSHYLFVYIIYNQLLNLIDLFE